jgi:hypothetical protein
MSLGGGGPPAGRLCSSEGFLFAFYRLSHADRNRGFVTRLFQGVVSAAVKSDLIHVAVAPVRWCVFDVADQGREMRGIGVGPTAYTAFIWDGFLEQRIETVLTPAFEYLFLPMEGGAMQEGKAFLHGLLGAKYNYLSLPLTLLPAPFKRRHHHNPPQPLAAPPPMMMPAVAATAGGLLSSSPHHHLDGGAAGGGGGGGADHRVFCSQFALMLCQRCGALSDDTDAAACTPGELFRMLREEAGALACSANHIKRAS